MSKSAAELAEHGISPTRVPYVNPQAAWHVYWSRMSKIALDYFGEVLMRRVRDEAIEVSDSLVRGELKSMKGQEAKRLFAKMPAEQRKAIQWLIPEVVDKTLHQLLWMLDERADDIRVSVTVDGATTPSLAATSDGLTGEPYTEEGWVARYSKQRANPF